MNSLKTQTHKATHNCPFDNCIFLQRPTVLVIDITGYDGYKAKVLWAFNKQQ